MAKKKSASTADANDYIRILIGFDQEKHESIFIEDSIITKILLQVLGTRDTVSKYDENLLINEILDKCRPDHIRMYATLVRTALGERIRSGYRQSGLILYSLVLNPSEKQTLLQFLKDTRFIPSSIRALYGDSAIIDSFKYAYENAKSLHEIRNSANILRLIVEDSTIPKSLMTRFCSNQMFLRVSARVVICDALAFIYPDNPVFKNTRKLFEDEKTYAFFHGKSNKERLPLQLQYLNRGIPDSIVDYSVVANRIAEIKNWYAVVHKTELSCKIERPFFTAGR